MNKNNHKSSHFFKKPEFTKKHSIEEFFSPLKPVGVVIGLGIIKIYQIFFSPFFMGTCRFQPTCSVYGEQAVRKYGLLRGGIMAIKRFLRCRPFSNADPYDPVP